MYFKTIRKKCRDILSFSFHFTHYFSMVFLNHHSYPVLGYLLTSVPAMTCACSGEALHEVPLHKSSSICLASGHHEPYVGSSPLDIFAFENDRLRRLDSYQRIEEFTGNDVTFTSTGGEKTFFLCTGGQRDRYEWSDISSYSSLREISCDLENETLHCRTMTGGCTASAGDRGISIQLQPLTCEIVLKALCCDFSGTPYAQAVIRDVKAYITNVNASCPLLYLKGDRATRIINNGMLNESDLRMFRSKEIISRHVAEEVGRSTILTDATFLCYPNTPEEDSPGSPFTRLVIEGTVDSHTYYWPITVNASGGVERGCRYIYDVSIRRIGVTDPDTPVEPTGIEFEMNIRPWHEKEEYSVGF